MHKCVYACMFGVSVHDRLSAVQNICIGLPVCGSEPEGEFHLVNLQRQQFM